MPGVHPRSGVLAPGASPTRTEVAVLGAGILGCLTALQCARAGLSVTLIEREPAIWSRASLHNEGKVHLGLVYALGGSDTRRTMLGDALRFAPEIERALDATVDWTSLQTEGFRYIVMPDSLLDIADLADRYREIDAMHREAGRPRYLGESLDRLVDLAVSVDELSGLPCFSTAERAVDPVALRTLVHDRLAVEPGVEQLLTTSATRITPGSVGAVVELESAQSRWALHARVVIDCRWEHQGAGVPGRTPVHRNVRVKAAVKLHAAQPVPTATLVAGPFGDLVQHRDYAYISWYPDARLHHEFSAAPSSAADAALARVDSAPVIESQLRSLRRFGWLQGDVQVIEGVGGYILGEGAIDISSLDSSLHDRLAAGLDRYGDVLVPRSWKFSSAPTAAAHAASAAATIAGRR